MSRQCLAKFTRWCGVLLVSGLTFALTAPGVHAQSATIRARATVVRPPVQAAVLDSAVVREAVRALAIESAATQLAGGVQVRRVERTPEVREVRVEFVAN